MGQEREGATVDGFTRPEVSILDENAIVPDKNLIVPAPDQFTHEVVQSAPFFYGDADSGGSPAGELPAGTRVVLLVHDGGKRCRVADGRGLYVEIDYKHLRKL
jgi:hypothetical protein